MNAAGNAQQSSDRNGADGPRDRARTSFVVACHAAPNGESAPCVPSSLDLEATDRAPHGFHETSERATSARSCP